MAAIPISSLSSQSAQEQQACPVCAFCDPWSGAMIQTICPCCGTHIGHESNYADLRGEWIAQGCQFWAADERPNGWTADEQLRRLARES